MISVETHVLRYPDLVLAAGFAGPSSPPQSGTPVSRLIVNKNNPSVRFGSDSPGL